MKSLFGLLLVFLATPALRAAWTLSESNARPAPAGLEFSECEVANGENRARLWVVSFNPKTHAFAVMDNPTGDFNLGSAAEKRGALAGVNGGYFHPDRTPL